MCPTTRNDQLDVDPLALRVKIIYSSEKIHSYILYLAPPQGSFGARGAARFFFVRL